jgi:poly(A) polymerase/tRNA nucleotidyltransferase (CCA-adding enzyme)
MKTVKDFIIPPAVLAVAKTLEDAGYEAYLVGGCVRDMFLDKKPKDWDITTNATPEEIQKLYPETFYENAFGTVGVVSEADDETVRVVEVTPYRTEGEYSDARRPDHVEWATSISDDLKRRDFTANAIAYRPATGESVDEHGGQEDLKKKLLRAVGDPGERFKEDALRMMRAVRLSAELGFAIEAETATAIYENADNLKNISKERVRDELVRILETKEPLQALLVAQKLGLLKYIIPELEQGIGIAQNQAHSYDVYEHNMRAMQHAADKEWTVVLRLAALLHDIAKPATRVWSDEKKDWTFHGHEVIGAKMTKKILTDLRFSKDLINKVGTLVRWHMFFSDPDKVTLSAVRRTIRNVGVDSINDLLNLRICDRVGTGRPKEQPFRFRKYKSMVDEALRDPISVGMLAVDGTTLMEKLGEKPGPRIGWILHALLEEVLEDPGLNTLAHLEPRAKELAALPDAELKKLGEAGRDARDERDAEAVAQIRSKHHVD